jgi:hypothetical protein
MKNLKFIFNNSAYDSKSLTFISQLFERENFSIYSSAASEDLKISSWNLVEFGDIKKFGFGAAKDLRCGVK